MGYALLDQVKTEAFFYLCAQGKTYPGRLEAIGVDDHTRPDSHPTLSRRSVKVAHLIKVSTPPIVAALHHPFDEALAHTRP